MKASILIFLCAASLTASAQIPDTIVNRFQRAHPNAADVQWKTQPNQCYRAKYRDENRKERISYCDNNGRIFIDEYKLTEKEIPADIVSYYGVTYPSEKNYEVWVQEKPGEDKTYYITRKEEQIFFDKNGKYTKKVKITTEKDKM